MHAYHEDEGNRYLAVHIVKEQDAKPFCDGSAVGQVDFHRIQFGHDERGSVGSLTNKELMKKHLTYNP